MNTKRKLLGAILFFGPIAGLLTFVAIDIGLLEMLKLILIFLVCALITLPIAVGWHILWP